MSIDAAGRASEDPTRTMGRGRRWGVLLGLLLALGYGATALAQTGGLPARLISQPINEQDLVTLAGNTRPEMTPANDRGPVADDLPLRHMYLQLKRSPEQESAATALVNQLHDSSSPLYHHWLTAAQVAAQFGPSSDDVNTVSSWLQSHGFTINHVYLANGVIDFSGTAGAIREAFHTEIHQLSVNGQPHIANAADPRVPAALAPAILGIVSLNDFRPHPQLKPRAAYTINAIYQLLVPGDLQTIYDISPIYSHGISGEGQTIVVLEDSDLYSTADWHRFRETFGLTSRFPKGTLAEVHPQPSESLLNGGSCADPGVNVDDGEAAVDVEWASAAAPSAAIVLASCADTETNFGGFIAMQNLLTGSTPAPAIISNSYGASESLNGAVFNAYVNELYELGVLQGVSVIVAAGDAGADTTDEFARAAVSGINVNSFATTPNDLAVGGTDFADSYFGLNSSYWSATNGRYYNSALSYIPEIPWNDSCGSQLIASFLGYATTFGPEGLCNSPIGEQELLIVAAGSGGPSSCAYGNPSIPGIVGGSCRGYAKPPYQSLVYGNPNDGVRDIPDVSLFASNGIWGHYYVLCYSDPSFGGVPCTGAPDTWAGGGGTSFGAPIMAGVLALIEQASQTYQGNPDFVLYLLAALEYGPDGSSACNSTLGIEIASTCIFHDVTLGDDDVNCLPLANGFGPPSVYDCFLDGATNGVLSTSNFAYRPAYVTRRGYDYPSGIGSIDAFNLLKAWPGTRIRGSGGSAQPGN
jgi:subtilase family serine protease